MKTFGVIVIIAIIVFLTLGGCTAINVVSTLNTDVQQKNRIVAQVEVRDIHFDKVYKIIQQKTQITKVSSEQQKELVQALIQGRQGGFIKLIHESNPESAFSREQFTDLSNSIEAQREGFFREQKVLVDIVRENQNLHDSILSGFVLSIAGRERSDNPILIKSEAVEKIISSGQENNIDLGL